MHLVHPHPRTKIPPQAGFISRFCAILSTGLTLSVSPLVLGGSSADRENLIQLGPEFGTGFDFQDFGSGWEGYGFVSGKIFVGSEFDF
jgi:hypothetical protein